MLTVFDLFSGCGGLSHGLKSAGFVPSWANEFDPHAAATFQKNHPGVTLFPIDARELLKAIKTQASGYPKRGEVSLVCGGPPCQGFCEINRHRHIEDERNSLVEVFYEFVNALRPSAVLMENVTGILTLGQGVAIKSLLNALREIGYETQLGIFQAGHFGIPQNRWRIFLVGVRSGAPKPLMPTPIHRFHSTNFVGMPLWRAHVVQPPTEGDLFGQRLLPSLVVADAIADLPTATEENGGNKPSYKCSPNTAYQSALRSKLCTEVYDHVSLRLEPVTLERCRLIPQGGGWLDLPPKLQPNNLKNYKKRNGSFNNRYGRLTWDIPFSAIVTKPEPYWGRYLHPDADRVISVRECARAQSFPDDFHFLGPYSARYRQVGNAVPPLLAKAVGESIRGVLQRSR